MRSLAGSMESNMVATAKPSQNEVKSHEILLGNNLNQHGTVSISYNSQKFSTLGRTSGSGHNTANMSSDCDTSKLTRYIAMSELTRTTNVVRNAGCARSRYTLKNIFLKSINESMNELMN